MSILPAMAQAGAVDSATPDAQFDHVYWPCQIVEVTTYPIARIVVYGVAEVRVGGGSICI